VETCQTDPTYVPNASSVMPIYHGETGELLKNLEAPWSLRLSRKRWLKMISKDIDIKVGSIDTRMDLYTKFGPLVGQAFKVGGDYR